MHAMHECNNHKHVKQYKAQGSTAAWSLGQKSPKVSAKVHLQDGFYEVPKVMDPSSDIPD